MAKKHFTINEDTEIKLMELASKRNVSQSAIVNIALTKYLEEELK